MLLSSFFSLSGQEELAPLMYNEALRGEISIESTSIASRDIERKPFIYKVDTIPLPFFDDFTKNKIKIYNAKETDDNISLKVLFGFTVNGEHPPYLDLVYEPTYDKTKPISGPIQFDGKMPTQIVFYDEIRRGNSIEKVDKYYYRI